MKIIDVHGIEIKEYPLKELLKLASDNLNTPGVTTVSWLSDAIIQSAREDPEQADFVENIDITIYTGAGGKNRLENNDGKSRDFAETYLNYLANTGVDVALVSDSEGRLQKTKRWLLEKNSKLKISTEFILDDMELKDDMFNVLNSQMNKIVILCASWDLHGAALDNAHRFSNAAVWMAILPEMLQLGNEKKISLLKRIGNIFR